MDDVGEAHCSSKRLRLDASYIPNFPNDVLKTQLLAALDEICFAGTKYVSLIPMKLNNCNGASNCGVPFSKAFCEVQDFPAKSFLLGEVFRRGIEMLAEYIGDGKLPESKQEQHVLRKLMSYITEQTSEDFFVHIVDKWMKGNNVVRLSMLSETQLTTVLANHLFGQLATSSRYIIDKRSVYKGKGKKKSTECFCDKANCTLTGFYGDTSIGHGEVWHGHLDIIINNELFVDVVEDESDDPSRSPGGKSGVEVKADKTNLSKNLQLIAQTIVFSFLQKQNHPERSNYLTPCIGVGHSELIVMFYDSEFDVLLQSSVIQLTDPEDKKCTKKISLSAILISWLVINYKYLCSGLTDDIKSTCTADFFTQAKSKLEIYQTKLQLGDVGISCSSEDGPAEESDVSMSPFLFQKHLYISNLIFKEKQKKGKSEDVKESESS